MITLITVVLVLVVLAVLILMTYTVIEPNEVHIITIMGSGRKIYSPKDLKDKVINNQGEYVNKHINKNTSYFYIPFLMKRMILPLTNIKMSIDNIHLNDKAIAPFVCDVITWITVENPIIASEKLSPGTNVFISLEEDLKNIVQAVARTVSMKQEILDILRDRDTFSKAVFAEVDPLLKKWGVDLVNLEVNDIKDDTDKSSRVIADYESIRKVEINSQARKKTSILDREAVEVEQSNIEKSEVSKANSEKNYTKARIEKDRSIGVANQDKDKGVQLAQKSKETEVATADGLANTEKIKASRKLIVGEAEVGKEAAIEEAKGIGEAIRIEGEKKADVTKLQGTADGSVIEAKGQAEAKAKDAMAEALKKFNDAGISLEKIRAAVQIAGKKWEAYGKVAENAEIKVVNSGKGGDLFGIPMNAETGANFGAMLDGLDASKMDFDKIAEVIKGTATKDVEDETEQLSINKS